MRHRKLATLASLVPIAGAVALGGLSSSYMVPVDNDAIQYSKGALDDPIFRLQKKIDAGTVKLQYEDEFGYLRSVLNALKVPPKFAGSGFFEDQFSSPPHWAADAARALFHRRRDSRIRADR